MNGCTIKIMYPSVEKAAKTVLRKLGIDFKEASDITCCPVPEVFYIKYPDLWRKIVDKNLEILLAKKNPVLVICNGCWELLRLSSGEDHLIKHAVEVLYKYRGRIKSMIQRDLSGIKVGLQPGCRLYVRDELIDMMRDLVEMLGVEVIEYGFERFAAVSLSDSIMGSMH